MRRTQLIAKAKLCATSKNPFWVMAVCTRKLPLFQNMFLRDFFKRCLSQLKFPKVSLPFPCAFYKWIHGTTQTSVTFSQKNCVIQKDKTSHFFILCWLAVLFVNTKVHFEDASLPVKSHAHLKRETSQHRHWMTPIWVLRAARTACRTCFVLFSIFRSC